MHNTQSGAAKPSGRMGPGALRWMAGRAGSVNMEFDFLIGVGTGIAWHCVAPRLSVPFVSKVTGNMAPPNGRGRGSFEEARTWQYEVYEDMNGGRRNSLQLKP
jgi:hypothetical protein